MNSASFEYINPRYLSGISDEPKQLLEPIFGYAREPLLSLEDACEPLLSIVPRLPEHIWIAVENSKNPSDGLTQNESAAIRLYTMEWDDGVGDIRGSLYAHLNRTLKQVDRIKLRPWFRYLKLFLTALAKLPAAPRQTVWRGVRKNHSDDYPLGTEATWWAFSSCTSSLSVLESDLYLGRVGMRTLFSIETLNSRDIRAHSHFQVEDEVLLLPGTYFEVKSKLNPATDLYIIHLQQKVPPHVLLEPPFEGAELLPAYDVKRDARATMGMEADDLKSHPRRWYKRKTVRIIIATIIAAIVILAVILGAVLGTRASQQQSANTVASSAVVVPGLNGTIPDPVSVADAFYAFDNNTFDLYSRRDGKIIGGPVSYVQGYVAYGQAIVLDQSIAKHIEIQPGFALNKDTSFTIEGFFLLQRTQISGILVQLTPTVTLNLTDGVLRGTLGANSIITGTSVFSTDQWHHISFVYDATQQVTTAYIDGSVEIPTTPIKLDISNDGNTSSVIVGTGFYGCIDQLSISLKAKSAAVISWDATVAGYYPMDVVWRLDKGPNGLNGTGSDLTFIYGWRYNALNFNLSGATFQASGFTALGTPRNPFSIALWVRAESRGGIFLTISNPNTCLLVLGLKDVDFRLIAYLPNATASGTGVNIAGPLMPPNAWAHVAFTWSTANRAQLYTSANLVNQDDTATTLNNARGDSYSLPMTVSLGSYNVPASCQGIAGVNSSQQFMGSLDELYIFSREISLSDLAQIVIPYPT